MFRVRVLEPRQALISWPIAIVVIACLGILGCQTQAVRFQDYSQASWQGRALIEDKSTSKRNLVKVVVNAEKNQQFRLDVTLPAGYHILTLIYRDSEVEFLIPAERRYFKGPEAQLKTFPRIALPVMPSELLQLIFDEVPARGGWRCSRGASRYLTKCRSEHRDIEVAWKERRGGHRVIEFKSPTVSVQLELSDFMPRFIKGTRFFIKPAGSPAKL